MNNLDAIGWIEGALGERERSLGLPAPREDVLWQLAEVLLGVPGVSASLLVVNEGDDRLRVLLRSLDYGNVSASVHDEDLHHLLSETFQSGGGSLLHKPEASGIARLAGHPPLDWAYLLPLELEGYFAGLVGVARASQAAAGGRARQPADGAMARETTEITAILHGARRAITRFLHHAALREQAFVAGMLRESVHLGTDLHDSVLQDLSFIRLQLGRLKLALPSDDERAQSIVQQMVSVISETSREMRQLCQVLTSANTFSDVLEAMDDVVRKFKGRCAATVDLAVEGERRRIGFPVASQLVRVLQEALNNVWKHAEASDVRIRLAYEPDKVVIEVRDNGRGFDLSSDEGHRIGLRGMDRRVREIRGTLAIQSEAGRGTTVRVEVPA